MTPNEVLQRFPDARATGEGQYEARCPAHEDRRASLCIGVRDEKILLCCQAGCETKSVVQAAGLKMSDLMPSSQTNGKARIVATYDYHDAHGKLVYQTVRMEPKDFRQRQPDGNGGWHWNMKGITRIPYRLPQLLASADAVHIAEGEKDVDRLSAAGIVASCNVGGAGKWRADYAPYFADRDVVVLPDNDPAGRKHAEQVALSLVGVAAHVRIVQLPGLPDKGDVSDWLDSLGEAADPLELLGELAEQTPPWTPVESVPKGTIVRANDRENFGSVVADNGKTCSVHFVSPSGQEATVELAKTDLCRQDGSPLDGQQKSKKPRFITELIDTPALLALDLKPRFLIRKVLVGGQPCVVGGRSKTLKTSITIDLIVSLASGSPFLEKFATERSRVAFWSGESGATTIRETARRVASSRGVDLAACPVFWGFDLPKLSSGDHLLALADVIAEQALDVVVIDPLYLALLSPETAGMAGNVFAMGSMLQPLSELAQATDVTIIVLHHYRKTGQTDREEPAPLEELAQSGIVEWARQWILLERRQPYQADGHHKLWMRAGGSFGHSGLYAVDVDEGVYEPEQPDSRHWDVVVRTTTDVRAEVKQEYQDRKIKDQEERERDHYRRLIDAARTVGEQGDTEKALRVLSGLNHTNFGQALTVAVKDGRIVKTEIQKANNQTYEGWKWTGK